MDHLVPSIKSETRNTGCQVKMQGVEFLKTNHKIEDETLSAKFKKGDQSCESLAEQRRGSVDECLERIKFENKDGSYGLVKLAYSEEDSTHYAMKILSKKRLLRQAGLICRGPRKATSPLDRVYREIAVLKKLDHPNVVKLVEVLDDPLEDSLYMVFELVKQGEVLRIPTEKPLSEQRAWSIFRESLLGLEYLHHQKIIHADIKPGNLLLTECGHVKIADLGVCNEFLGEDAKISNGSTAGTPAFRAPETLVLGQNKYCGKAADVWALGATLYSLIFGNVPFLADSVPLLYEKIKRDCVVFPENHSATQNLKSCIFQMLEKDAGHRITVPQLKANKWVTSEGEFPLPTEEENCCLVQVDDEDINSVVRSIPKLDTLILIKTMLKKHSFGNPFVKESVGKSSAPSGLRIERFVRAGRSNSAPGSYHMSTDRQPSADTLLPSLKEHCSGQCNGDSYSNLDC
ncbi:calcium/calmodulin-dependent protein kinase kinase 2 isoform X2 [Drosophila takahashii]|uniref:calcium/calmodulin-dependent protein kinase kinase 2 isoform X2 n=1 Tax=Drosophila takahashii TaxID=29030 RepID=UPI0038993058